MALYHIIKNNNGPNQNPNRTNMCRHANYVMEIFGNFIVQTVVVNGV